MTIIIFVLSFTVLGFVNQHYIIITSGQEQKIITEITSNAIHSEIIISYLTSINEMDTYQKMMNLNLTKSEANSLKQIQCFRTPLPAANTDMILKKMVKLQIHYRNRKTINKIIDHLINYINKQPFIIDEIKKFNHLLVTKKELIKSMDDEINRIQKNKFSLNEFLEYNNINTIDLFKFKLKLETEVSDIGSITIINKGIIKTDLTPESIVSMKSIVGFTIIGFSLAIVFIYFQQSVQGIKNQK